MLAPPYHHPMTVSRRPRTRRSGDTTVDVSRIGGGGEAFDVVGVVDPLAALEAQREGERVGDVFGCGAMAQIDVKRSPEIGTPPKRNAGRSPAKDDLSQASLCRLAGSWGLRHD